MHPRTPGGRRRPPVAFFSSALAAVTLLASSAYAQETPPLAPLPPSDAAVAPPPVPLQAPPALRPSEAAPPGLVANPRAVWMHVQAHRPVMLQLLAPYETRWAEVCWSPCEVAVPLDGAYRIAAPGIMGSRELELEANPGDRVVLDVNVRTVAEHRTAERLTIAGYIAGAVGLGLEIGALAVNSDTAQEALLWSGAGAAVAAITLAITSYVMGQPSGLSQASASPMSGPPAALGPALPPWKAIPSLKTAF
jgi:hypothetical protein